MKKIILAFLVVFFVGESASHPVTITMKVKNVSDTAEVTIIKTDNQFGFGKIDTMIRGKCTMTIDVDTRPGVTYEVSFNGNTSISGRKQLCMTDKTTAVKVTENGGQVELWKANIKSAEQKMADRLDQIAVRYPIAAFKDAQRDSIYRLRSLKKLDVIETNPNLSPALSELVLIAKYASHEQLIRIYQRMSSDNQKSTAGRVIQVTINPPSKIYSNRMQKSWIKP